MNHKLLNRLGLALVVAASLPLVAETPTSYYFSAGVVDTQADLRKLTAAPFGFATEIGVQTQTKDGGMDFVGHVGWLKAGQDQLTGSAKNYTAKAGHFGVGVLYPLGNLPANLEVGLVMHAWDVANLYSPTGGKGETSWKLGARVVATTNFDQNWGLKVGYTFSEYQKGINPSYFYAGVNYKF